VAVVLLELTLASCMFIINVTSLAYACLAVCCRNSEKNPEDFSVINSEGQCMTIQDLQGCNKVVHPTSLAVPQAYITGKFLQVNAMVQ